MTQYGFYYDATRCTGCKTCALACKDYNDLAEDVAFRNVVEYAGGTWTDGGDGTWTTDSFIYNVSIACNHCDDPACLNNCPVSAYAKDEETGRVWADPEICIGCGTCVTACPDGAPSVDKDLGKSVKCTMCVERVEQGMNPICVDSCSLRALEFGPVDELREKYGDDVEIAPLPAKGETLPNLCIKLPVNARPIDDKTGAIANAMDIVLGE